MKSRFLFLFGGWLMVFLLLLPVSLRASAITKADSIVIGISQLPEPQRTDSLKRIILDNLFRDPKMTFILVKEFHRSEVVQNDSTYLFLSYYWKGMIYEIFGDYNKAIENDFKALAIANSIKSEKRRAITLNNIGLVYSYQVEYYKQALEYFKKYLSLARQLHLENDIMGAYNNLAMVFTNMEMADSAAFYAELTIEQATKLDDKRHIALASTQMAKISKQRGNYAQCIEYSRKAENIYKSEHYLVELAALYYDISTMFYEDNQLDSASFYAHKMLEIADEYELTTYKSTALQRLSNIYSSQHIYDIAYEYLSAYEVLNDSLNKQDTRESLARMQTLYELDLKEKEIDNFRIKSDMEKRKEQFYLFAMISLLLVATVIIYLFMLKRKKDLLLLQQKALIHNNEKKMAALELEKSRANEAELQTQLAFRTRQLTTHALSMMQKNKMMQELSGTLKAISRYARDEQKDEMRKLQQQIKRNLNVDKDWDLFKMYFEQVNKDFFTRLLEKFPSLSPNDLRLSALIKLNMNIKEAASVFNLEPASVKSARYRLRKKLGLRQEDDLYEFMRNV